MYALKSPLPRLLLFLVLAGAAFATAGVFVGMAGAQGARAAVWFGAVFAAGLFAATVVCARLGGERLTELGFRATRRDGVATLVAFGAGALLFVGVALSLGRAVGGEWRLGTSAPLWTALAGLVPVLCLFVSEELLFRGYAFQQGRGRGAAVIVSALVFGAYHWLGSATGPPAQRSAR
jgi:membrane protease YdiL (CAAX protease family)